MKMHFSPSGFISPFQVQRQAGPQEQNICWPWLSVTRLEMAPGIWPRGFILSWLKGTGNK